MITQKKKILTTGKYLNVIRECGKDFHVPFVGVATSDGLGLRGGGGDGVRGDDARNIAAMGRAMSASVGVGGGKGAQHLFSERVEAAYAWASHELKDLLMNPQGEVNTLRQLRSMKRFLLLDTGDFFVHFLDLASTELAKPGMHVDYVKVCLFYLPLHFKRILLTI